MLVSRIPSTPALPSGLDPLPVLPPPRLWPQLTAHQRQQLAQHLAGWLHRELAAHETVAVASGGEVRNER